MICSSRAAKRMLPRPPRSALKLSDEEIAVLVARGRQLMIAGDIPKARLCCSRRRRPATRLRPWNWALSMIRRVQKQTRLTPDRQPGLRPGSTNSARWTEKKDALITRVGTRMDELPQLWNVLLREMSFIGPRPERPDFKSELEAAIHTMISGTW